MNITGIHDKLKTRWLGHKIHHKESTGSTNKWAKDAIHGGCRRGELFLAEFQSEGKGRKSRSWESARDKNILMSFVDNPPFEHDKVYHLTSVTGVSIISAFKSLYPSLTWHLKWPNDILLEGKKMGGILCEYLDHQKQVVVGVGLNINADKDDFSPELRAGATSLGIALGRHQSREDIIATCLSSYEEWRSLYDQEGLRPITDSWNQICHHHGQRVTVIQDGDSRIGISETIDENGFLIVNENGKRHKIMTGDTLCY